MRQRSASHVDPRTAAPSTEQRAFTQREASVYLGLEPGSRWLDDAPIPRVDMRKPGAAKPVWRWLREDLDAFLELRRVEPGRVNPMDLQ